jgi:quinolinate synthase
MATEYEKLVAKPGAIRRGRPSDLSDEQRAQRKEEQKRKTRIRNEARRRAHIVLQHKYTEEYEQLLAAELTALNRNS